MKIKYYLIVYKKQSILHTIFCSANTGRKQIRAVTISSRDLEQTRLSLNVPIIHLFGGDGEGTNPNKLALMGAEINSFSSRIYETVDLYKNLFYRRRTGFFYPNL